jgi:hypothetical protein
MTGAASIWAVSRTCSFSKLKRSSAIAVLILGIAPGQAVADCADLPSAAPPPFPVKSVANERYEPLRGFDRALRLGIGHLRPAREDDRLQWLHFVLLPLAARPGEPRSFWFSGGWVIPAAGATPRRIGNRGALETGDQTVSLIVLEQDHAGWLRIRFAPGEEASSTGWVHVCDLEKVRPRVVYESWERLFAERALSPLYFRTGGPRALRRGPQPGEEALAWIPAEGRRYALEALEFHGDWMFARLTVPFDYCRMLDAKPVIREGWVRWRDRELGPLLWYYTRSC